ncbi:MAG: CBS domain-containing protein [Halanaerobiales bacterium]
MEIIAAHDLTDLDGLAAMVAASKLYPEAKRVFVGRLHRMVKDFMALYRDEIQIYHLSELEVDEITKVIIVDTHNIKRLGRLKEMVDWQQAEVIVYDHHPHSPQEWIDLDMSEKVGSATTILVRRIMAENINLTPLEATVCALGIYADTGNFTHQSTTAEDLRCLAFLLESGVNMKIINDFLQEKLNSQQQEIMNLLSQNRETMKIDGVEIEIFSVNYQEFVPGLNRVCEKLKYLYHLPALFVLAEMEGKVSLIGRSSDERIDIGRICTQLDGGGHSGAGATQLKMKLAQAKKELVTAIEENVITASRVKDIMSYPVRTISPEATIAEAEQMMAQFGHSGLVVCEKNEVKGIFSRRDLIKVKGHDLMQAPVKGYMSRNVISIEAEAQIQKARDLMVKYNIGRLPVMKEGKVVGIVTRSDILSSYYQEESPHQYQNRYGGSMVDIEPETVDIEDNIEYLSSKVVEIMRETGKAGEKYGCQIYLIGGMVRDLLLDRENTDLDFVVEGELAEIIPFIASRLGGEWNYNEQFHTGSIILKNGYNLDLATTRREHYAYSGALPEVEKSDIFEDLFRRDYTVNALALAVHPGEWGILYDFFQGRRDLNNGKLRALHRFSFLDDPTRIIRGVRLAEELDFDFEQETEKLMQEALFLGDFSRVTRARIYRELEFLMHNCVDNRMIRLLKKIPVFKLLYRDFKLKDELIEKIKELEKYLAYFADRNYNIKGSVLRMSLFLEQMELPDLTEWNIEKEDQRILNFRDAEIPEIKGIEDPARLTEVLDSYNPEKLILLLARSKKQGFKDKIEYYLKKLRDIQPDINGHDLQELGLKPGPEMRKILTAVRKEKLRGKVNGRDEERQLAARLITNKDWRK